jgi:hypothetical protein
MTGCPVELSVRGAHLAHQNAAVVQACVPLVALKGDSYRLRDKDLEPRAPTPDDSTD